MKKRYFIFLTLIIALTLNNDLFSQSSYYAADFVKIDEENERMYTLIHGKVAVFDIKTQKLLTIIETAQKMENITTIDLNIDKLLFANESKCCIINLKTNDQLFADINEQGSNYSYVWIKLREPLITDI